MAQITVLVAFTFDPADYGHEDASGDDTAELVRDILNHDTDTPPAHANGDGVRIVAITPGHPYDGQPLALR